MSSNPVPAPDADAPNWRFLAEAMMYAAQTHELDFTRGAQFLSLGALVEKHYPGTGWCRSMTIPQRDLEEFWKRGYAVFYSIGRI